MADPAFYAASDEQMRASQEAAVTDAQSTGEFVLSATDPVTDGTDWWITFDIGPVDGPAERQFEYRRPLP
jgi:hypothetical protein